MTPKYLVTVTIKKKDRTTFYCLTSEEAAVPHIAGIACDLLGIVHQQAVEFVEGRTNSLAVAYDDSTLTFTRELF